MTETCHVSEKVPGYWLQFLLGESAFWLYKLTPVSGHHPASVLQWLFTRMSQLNYQPRSRGCLKTGTWFKQANKLAANCLSNTCWRRHYRSPPTTDHPVQEREGGCFHLTRNHCLKTPCRFSPAKESVTFMTYHLCRDVIPIVSDTWAVIGAVLCGTNKFSVGLN